MDKGTSRSQETAALADETSPPQPRLRPEVLYPQRQNTGVGIMLVASAAMFFAVASSAFILRAQMPMSECPGQSRTLDRSTRPAGHEMPIEAIQVDLVDVEESRAKVPCGEPSFHPNDDGPSTVVFELCEREP